MAVGIKSITNKSNVFLLCCCLVLATTLSFSNNALAQGKTTKKNNKPESTKAVKEPAKETKETIENKPAEIDSISQFESDVAEERVIGLNKLLTDNNPQIVDFITRALKDIDWLVRANALQSITKLEVKQRAKLLPKISALVF